MKMTRLSTVMLVFLIIMTHLESLLFMVLMMIEQGELFGRICVLIFQLVPLGLFLETLTLLEGFMILVGVL